MPNLKRILRGHGISYRALASEIGVSPTAVSNLVNHGALPKRDAARIRGSIAAFLAAHVGEVDIDDALSSEKETASGRGNARRPRTNTEKEDMLLRKHRLTPEALQHFALSGNPFDQEIDSHEDIFLTQELRYAREAMLDVAERGGFLAIIGESGSGKSTLRQDLIDRIRREERPIVVIEPYVLGMEDNDRKGKTLRATHIAEAILHALHPDATVRQSPEARFRQVHNALKHSSRTGMQHVLILEEAHGLATPTIKHLKRFIEMKEGFKGLLSILLIGQQKLRKRKISDANFEVREVAQRCQFIELGPMDTEIGAYLAFKLGRIDKDIGEVIDEGGIAAIQGRLTLSGNRQGRREAISMVYPLVVNNLMAAAMNRAAFARSPMVTADAVTKA
uniref:Type II secretory pathway, component ExeA (Predicted ATPase) n=1 Tax=Candidatus Kentrum sp. LFY TaxID=2126342 RepID=A0A450WGL9_9GAMM|nr:MAG: Type II secretory pathway, component ExeA (predicted ATPase) [Candidatus Kentron sp. LFY]